MRIRALSVFEHVVYHSACVDPSNPSRPTLEVEAVVREGDVDDGPILLPWADFVVMAGKPAAEIHELWPVELVLRESTGPKL